jgi:hypothetical protein
VSWATGACAGLWRKRSPGRGAVVKTGSRAFKSYAKQKQSKSKAIQRVKRCQEMSRAKPSVPSVLRSLQLSCIAMHCYASLPRLFRIAAVLLMRRISDSTFSSASSSTKSVLESQHRVKKKGKDWIQSSSQRSSAF